MHSGQVIYSVDQGQVTTRSTTNNTWVTVCTTEFTPNQPNTKFVVLGTIAGVGNSSYIHEEPYSSLDADIDAAMLVDGVTVCQSFYNYNSFVWFGECQNRQYEITIRARSGASIDLKNIKICAFSVEEYETIEQEVSAELTGPTNIGSKLLMQQIYNSSYNEVLAIGYAEIKPSDTGFSRTGFSIDLDDSIDTSILKCGVASTQNSFISVANIKPIKLYDNIHTVAFKCKKSINNDKVSKFRRLRCVLIPLCKFPISTIQQNTISQNEYVSLEDMGELGFNVVENHTHLRENVKYIAISSAISGPKDVQDSVRVASRFDGLGLDLFYSGGGIGGGGGGGAGGGSGGSGSGGGSGGTSDPEWVGNDGIPVFGGHTGGDIFDVTTSRVWIEDDDPSNEYIEGFCGFGFHVGTQVRDEKCKFLTYNEFYSVIHPPTPNSSAVLNGNMSSMLLQIDTLEPSITDVDIPMSDDRHGLRTIIEVCNRYNINRYSFGQDFYLFDGLTYGQILNKIKDGSIEEACVRDLTVTGQQVLAAIDRNDDATALSLLQLDMGLPDGVTPTPASEYRTKDSIYKEYKGQVVSTINTSYKAKDIYYGVVESDTASFKFFNSTEFLENNPIDELYGAIIKIKEYDPINYTLKCKFTGVVLDLQIGDMINIVADSQAKDVLEMTIPSMQLKNLRQIDGTYVNKEVVFSNSEGHHIPVFFGLAKRSGLDNILNDYGVEDSDPPFIDAKSDFCVGGFLSTSRFQSVVAIKDKSPTGMYRSWLRIDDSIEFADESNIVETNKYLAKSFIVPSVSFKSYVITEYPQVEMPLPFEQIGANVTVNNQDLRLYEDFVPVQEFIKVEGFRKYIDWKPNLGVPNTISWIDGGTYPDPMGIGLTLMEVTRLKTTANQNILGIGYTDYITASETNTAFKEVLNINTLTAIKKTFAGITAGTIVCTEGNEFKIASSNSYRNLEDIVDWYTPEYLNRSIFEFQDSLRNTDNTLSFVAHQNSPGIPLIEDGTSCVEFIQPTGFGFYTVPSTEGIWTFEDTQNFRCVAYISVNSEGICDGPVVGKRTSNNLSGFYIEIDDDLVLRPSGRYGTGGSEEGGGGPISGGGGVGGGGAGPGGGSTDPEWVGDDGTGTAGKMVPVVYISDGASFIPLLSKTGLTDDFQDSENINKIHKIDVRILRNFYDNKDMAFLYVDNMLVDTAVPVTGNKFRLADAFNLTIGAKHVNVTNSVTKYNPPLDEFFFGKLHRLELSENGVGEPGWMDNYYVYATTIPNAFTATWSYEYKRASNPTFAMSDDGKSTVIPVGGDFKIAGCDLTALTVTGTILPTINLDTFWNRELDYLGYGLRLNSYTSTSAWNLGTSQLGVGTTLGAIGTTDGRVEFDDHPDFRFEQDFTVYGFATWNGTDSDNALLVAKENISGRASYGIGIKAGKAYGFVVVSGQLMELVGNIKITSGTPTFLQFERKGMILRLYVNGVLDKQVFGLKHWPEDYDSGKLVVGSNNLPTFYRWVGTVFFFGMLDFAGDLDFHKMQYDLIGRGVKGCYVEKTIGSTLRKTVFHVPFTEGEGAVVKSRNLHRNPALSIKRILVDPVFGILAKTNSYNFDKAATYLDDLKLKVDFYQKEPQPLSYVLEKLTMIKGITLKSDIDGSWDIFVDKKPTNIKGYFGSGDGVYNNIISCGDLKYTSRDDSVKTLKLSYRYLPDSEGNLTFACNIVRNVLDYGVQEKVYENPYLYDHYTADYVSSYLCKKYRYNNKEIKITVGRDGKNLKFNDLVELTIPRKGIDKQIFQINSIAYNGVNTELTLFGFNEQIYNYSPGPFPDDENYITSAEDT